MKSLLEYINDAVLHNDPSVSPKMIDFMRRQVARWMKDEVVPGSEEVFVNFTNSANDQVCLFCKMKSGLDGYYVGNLSVVMVGVSSEATSKTNDSSVKSLRNEVKGRTWHKIA